MFSKVKTDLKINYVNITLAALALFNVIIHLVTSFNLEYHRDELLYFSLGLHPAFGYATVPPLIGWVAWLMQNIFGYSIFAVRLFPALLSGAMVCLVAAIARELGGSGYSRLLAATGMIISIVGLRTFLLFQPVHIDLIFWTLSFYLIIKYINTGFGKYLIMFGLMAGFALLNKYLIGLLFVLSIIIIVFTKHRTIFRNKYLWYGVLAGFMVFLPNLIWQINHELPVINHLSELKDKQLVNVDRAAFLVEQIAIPATASFLTIAGIIFLLFNKSVIKFRFIGIICLSVIFTLMLLQGKSYYTQGIFPVLIAGGAVLWEKILKKTVPKALFLLFLIVLTLPVLPIGIPVYKTKQLVKYFDNLRSDYGLDFVTRFEDNSIHSLPQDYADMLGWEELTGIVNTAWQQVPDKESGFIYCENYGQAGAVTVIGKKYGLPGAVSFHESFRYWIPKQFNRELKSLVYVNDEMGDDVKSIFSKITIIGSIKNPDAREFGTTVWLCEEPSKSFNEFWTERIKEVR